MTFGEYLGAGTGVTKGLYHFNGNSNDSSGNGYNGTDTNISYVAGNFGDCASFNGTSSRITGTGTPTGTGSYTLSAWVNYTSAVDSYRMVVSIGAATSQNAIYITSYGATGKGKKLILGTYASATGVGMQNTPDGNDGKWHNVVGVFTGGNTLNMYRDGVLVGTDTETYNVTSSVYNIGSQVNNTTFRDGKIDEVIIENVARDASKVEKYYTYAKGRFGTL